MMRAMKRNLEMTEDDLLMLPPIDGLVHEIKGQETVSTVRQEPVPDKNMKGRQQSRSMMMGRRESSSWDMFLRCSEFYEYRSKKEDRKGYPIDVDIVNTLRQCDINKMSTCNVINAILRAFIEENKDILREYLTEKKSLL